MIVMFGKTKCRGSKDEDATTKNTFPMDCALHDQYTFRNRKVHDICSALPT
jgi:hypothetical protein